MKCVILAGGFGTRFYPFALNIPKPLLEVRGRPLISHIVAKVPEEIDIIVSTNRKFENRFITWKNGLCPQRQIELFVETACSEAEKPGAISALNMLVKEKKLKEDLLVIAGDNYFEFDLCRFVAAYDCRRPLIAVYDIHDISKARRFGVVILGPEYRVTAFVEKPAHPPSTIVSTACYLFPSRILSTLHEYCSGCRRDNLGGFIAHLVENDQVYAYTFLEKWYDIGSLESYLEVKQG
jgi:glucose-1-phosphate thymidylyltransferase